MKTLRLVMVVLVGILALSCIPLARAVEPSWTYSINESAISTLAVSSDGSTIIAAAGSLWIFSKDGSLLKKEKFGDNVVLTPSGRYAASSFGGTVFFFRTPLTTGPPDPKNLAKIWEYMFPDPVRSIDITDDGSTIVVGTQGLAIFIMTTATQNIAANDAFSNPRIRISHDGGRIVGIESNSFRIYGRNGKVSRSYILKSTNNPDFALLSQTVPLMVFNDGPTIHSYDLSVGEELWNARPSGTLNSLAMTPSGSYVVAGTENGNITRYDDKGQLNWSYSSSKANSPVEGISKLALSRDGGLVAAASNEGTVLLLNMRGTLLGSYRVPDPIRSIAMSQDGSILLVASDTTIYAFFTGYTPSAGSSPSGPKTPAPGSLTASGQNITSPYNLTRTPVIPRWTKAPVPGTPTVLPTEYSIIRTPTQSPIGLWSGILALVAGVILYSARRR